MKLVHIKCKKNKHKQQEQKCKIKRILKTFFCVAGTCKVKYKNKKTTKKSCDFSLWIVFTFANFNNKTEQEQSLCHKLLTCVNHLTNLQMKQTEP